MKKLIAAAMIATTTKKEWNVLGVFLLLFLIAGFTIQFAKYLGWI